VHISRPANLTGATKSAPMALYSSKPATTKISSASNNIKTFIDLTASDTGLATNAHHYHTDISSFDSFSYVDAAKAQENIKALLEGAFEDEDDKPRTRSRKKRLEENVNKITSQLQGVTINGPKEVGKEDHGEEAAEDGYDGEDEEDDGTVEGLKVKLLPHQIEGVSWMHDKETGKKKTRGVLPKGGILADDMGLGKTVQAIALILTNRPSEESGDKEKGKHKEKRKESSGPDKGTLVVAPLALIKQWESEIETKVEDSHHLRVCVYHGAGRSKLADDLKKYDVVITTYGTLSSEHAASSKEAGCFSIYWHRVILDEAHTIKNRNAKATQAACALNAEFRWCLTGTPLQNNLDELQSLIAFLRIRPYNDLAAWREQITRPMNNGRGGLAVRRLQVYLKAFMKRRTKDVLKLSENFKPGEAGDKEQGYKTSTGFQITEREVIKVVAEFTPAELAFYQRLEQRTDSRLEQMMGGSHVNYASALVLLLRLRQACNHPDLVGSDLPEDRDVLLGNNTMGSQSKEAKQNDINQVSDLFGGLSVMSKNCDICQVELTETEAKSGKSRCHECELSLDVDVIKRQQKKHKKKKRSKKVDSSRSVHRDEKSRKARSQRNRRIIEDSDDDEDGEDGDWVVPKNQRLARNLSKAGGSEDENAEGGGEWLDSGDSETDEDGSLSQKNEVISLSSSFNDKSVNAPDDGEIQTGSDTNEEAGSDTDEDDLSDYEDDENDVLASTKIRYLMKILRRESRDYKFIVFSVFTTMLDKIEPFLKGENLGYARYDGSMRNDSREASLDRLRNHRKTRILLCSLRAGSLGLNLTAASRVVILEPFWNPV
jgi:SNF2 family DNA or RNA helicase